MWKRRWRDKQGDGSAALLEIEVHPGGSVVTGTGLSSDPCVDSSPGEVRCERRIQQEVIDSQAGVLLPMLPEVIPEGVDTCLGVTRAQGIGPAL